MNVAVMRWVSEQFIQTIWQQLQQQQIYPSQVVFTVPIGRLSVI
jgi:sensor c-di-GMP phosphodiesterase-like protein